MRRVLGLLLALVLLIPADVVPADAAEPTPRSKMLRALQADLDKRRVKPRPRIIGGSEAKAGDVPWQVAIVRRSEGGEDASIHCGGAFIRPNIVMTAAHCVVGSIYGNMGAFEVLNGDADLAGTGMTRYRITDAFVHPRYDDETFDYDFALLKVAGSYAGKTIELLSPRESAALRVGDTLQVSGWGVTDEATGATARKLQKVDVKVVSRSDCTRPQAYEGRISARMLCAGFASGGKDSCQGDSGGPLALRAAGGDWRLVGVVSWGEGCAQPDKYGVYGRLIEARNWVEASVELLETGKLGAEIQPASVSRPRIHRGQAAAVGELPWQAALISADATPDTRINDLVRCGATFIGRDVLATAAHCVDGLILGLPGRFKVLNGNGAVALDDPGMGRYEITDVLAHPRYDAETLDYDFAVLRVANADKSGFLRLPTPAENDEIVVGGRALVSGWGLDENGAVPTALQKLEVGIIARSICNGAQVYNGGITTRMMCAGYLSGGKDSCQGDSGGPLTYEVPSSGQTRLIGVVSWGGAECAAANKPGVYGRLFEVRDWVDGAVRLLATIR